MSPGSLPAWSWALSASALALLLGLVFHRTLRRTADRAQASTHLLPRVMAVLVLPAAFALPLLVATLALAAAPWQGRWATFLHHALVIALIGVVVWTLVRAIGAVERRLLSAYSLDVANNLSARRMHTQARVLGRSLMTLVVVLGIAAAFLTVPGMRQVGAGLLASAGLAGLVAGLAAQPILGNLIAGLQIAIAQPIRIDDVVIVEGEWGRIEEITSTYIVVAIWDERRLIVPLRWFIENPFENWTRTSSQVLGSVLLWLDYRTPMAAVRAEFERLCAGSDQWDGRVRVAQVVDCGEWSMQVRLLVSAADSGKAFGLRCEIREGMLSFLQDRHPESLPLLRSRLEPSAEQEDLGAPRDEVARSRHEAGWQPRMDAGAQTPDQGPVGGRSGL
jgi:small-conductance mechanosensitive channel